MDFEKYWEDFGELHASMCNGDIKQFAKEIWVSAQSELEQENAKLKAQQSNTRQGLEKMDKELLNYNDIESIYDPDALRDDCDIVGMYYSDKWVTAPTLADLIDKVALMEVK